MGTTVSKKSSNHNSSSDTDDGSYSYIRRGSSENDIMPRKVWWAPQRNQVEIHDEGMQYRNVKARVGSLANIEYRPGGGQVAIRDEPVKWKAPSRINSLANANWSPSVPRVSVRQEKLNWNAQSKVNSLDNVTHKPGGGSVEIYDEKLDFKHVAPRVNCGFLN